MQPDAQVLVREFNRRLRNALSSAPNHVRVEAALEVESHVLDVLSRHRSTLSEPEQVAEILAGFGTPEEYAKAFMAQLPEVQVVDVHTGAREVSIAAVDLSRGMGRLLVALLRRVAAFLLTVLHVAKLSGLWAYRTGRRTIRAARGPVGQAVSWLAARLNQLRRSALVLRLWMGRRIHDLRGMGTVGAKGLRWGWKVARWVVRAILILGLSGLALAAFAFAAFTALLPDVVGFWIYQVQTAFAEWLADVRRLTVAQFDQPTLAQFERTGHTILITAMVIGVLIAGLVAFVVWNARRRRGTLTDH